MTMPSALNELPALAGDMHTAEALPTSVIQFILGSPLCFHQCALNSNIYLKVVAGKKKIIMTKKCYNILKIIHTVHYLKLYIFLG